jgi:hypothetical protein
VEGADIAGRGGAGAEPPAQLIPQWVDERHADDTIEALERAEDDRAVGPRAGCTCIEVVSARLGGELTRTVGCDPVMEALVWRWKEPPLPVSLADSGVVLGVRVPFCTTRGGGWRGQNGAGTDTSRTGVGSFIAPA